MLFKLNSSFTLKEEGNFYAVSSSASPAIFSSTQNNLDLSLLNELYYITFQQQRAYWRIQEQDLGSLMQQQEQGLNLQTLN